MTAHDLATLAFYGREAPVYAASGKDGVSRWLPDFMRMLPVKSRILELGCGGSRDAQAMLATGFDVDATDGSPAIASLAAQRLGRQVRLMRFDELSAVGAYDAIWANASLLHATREALAGVLHFANYKSGAIEGRDAMGRYFNHPDVDFLRKCYVNSGQWEMLTVEDYMGGGYQQGKGPWVALIARRTGA